MVARAVVSISIMTLLLPLSPFPSADYPAKTRKMSNPESNALRSAKSLKANIAGWTLLYTTAILIAYACVFATALNSTIELWQATLLNMFIVYFAYTSLHEATHGNIADEDGPFAWLNPVIGVLSCIPMIHNYSLHRTTHLAHHKYTYDPERDADHWVKGSNAFFTLSRCMTIVVAHYRTGWKINIGSEQGRRALMWGAIQNLATLTPLIWLIATGRLQEALWIILIPAILGSTLLAFFFDYAVHYPKVGEDRWRRGRIYRASPWLQPIVTTLYVAQNFHQIHHLYPWVPFYRYPALFSQIEPLLRAKETPIINLGR
jgi:beta-carotene hydroxylase